MSYSKSIAIAPHRRRVPDGRCGPTPGAQVARTVVRRRPGRPEAPPSATPAPARRRPHRRTPAGGTASADRAFIVGGARSGRTTTTRTISAYRPGPLDRSLAWGFGYPYYYGALRLSVLRIPVRLRLRFTGIATAATIPGAYAPAYGGYAGRRQILGRRRPSVSQGRARATAEVYVDGSYGGRRRRLRRSLPASRPPARFGTRDRNPDGGADRWSTTST